MTLLLEREPIGWHAQVEVAEFTAQAERDTMHALFPARARLIDLASRRGYRLPGLVVPHVSGDMMRSCGFDPAGYRYAKHNLLVNAGINRMQSLAIGAGGQAWDATHTAIAVGDGNGSVPTAAATDTDLAALTGATHRYIQPADSTFPSAASQVITVQATVATGNGNFEWREWGVSQDTAGSTAAVTTPLLNHKGVDLGLKTSAAPWVFKVTFTQT